MHTADWYRSFQQNDTCLSQTQIKRYIEEAKRKEISWAI
jgi:hypothetical protein